MNVRQDHGLMRLQTIEEAERELEVAKRRALATLSATLDTVAAAAVNVGLARGGKAQNQLEGLAEAVREAVELIQPTTTSHGICTDQEGLADWTGPLPFIVRPRDAVLRVVTQSPGLRGMEIARLLSQRTPPVPEGTTRTALYRLRSENRIRVVDHQWYPCGGAAGPVRPNEARGGEPL